MSNLGVVITQHVSFAYYGTWGRYLLEAETLGQSLARFGAAIPMHASYSTYSVEQEACLAWIRYRFAVSPQDGKASVTFPGAGILIDLVRQYTGLNWMPQVINFDILRPPSIADIKFYNRLTAPLFGPRTLQSCFPARCRAITETGIKPSGYRPMTDFTPDYNARFTSRATETGGEES